MTAHAGPDPVPPVTVATSTNRAGTVSVRATDQGLPVDIRIDKRELRYGAQPLADEIMRLTKHAAVEAGARRRELLADAGVSDDVLNRLGLPTRTTAAREQSESDDADIAPSSWMRPV